MTVGELLARTSAQELTDWEAYETITGPLDAGHRADVLAGILAATIANAAPRRKGSSRVFRPSEFMPEWGGRRPQTWEQQLAAVREINRQLGGGVVQRRRE